MRDWVLRLLEFEPPLGDQGSGEEVGERDRLNRSAKWLWILDLTVTPVLILRGG